MEDTQVTPPQSTGFSVEPKAKNSNAKWLIIFIILLILGGAGIYFFTKSSNSPIPTPTPSFGVNPFDENEPTTAPTSTPAAVDKEEISIEIQNGTGVPGEAAFLQGKLKTLGYSDIKASNAGSTDHTATTVTFAKNTPQSVQNEIKEELEKNFKEVSVKTASTQAVDVLIVTGLRGTQTSKPSGSPKATGTSKPSATPTASPSN